MLSSRKIFVLSCFCVEPFILTLSAIQRVATVAQKGGGGGGGGRGGVFAGVSTFALKKNQLGNFERTYFLNGPFSLSAHA